LALRPHLAIRGGLFKMKADGNGNERPMSLNDYIEIGVFKGKKDGEVPLYLKNEKITREQNTYEITVDEMLPGPTSIPTTRRWTGLPTTT
jgi:hypothetical protein